MDSKEDLNKEKNKPQEMVMVLPIISVEEPPSFPTISNIQCQSSESGSTVKNNSQLCEENGKISNSFPPEDEFHSQFQQQYAQSSMNLNRRMTLEISGKISSFSSLKRTLSEETNLDAERAEELEQRLRNLVSAFSARTKKTKAKIKQPPTPSSSESETDESTAGEANLLERLKSLNGSRFLDDRRKSVSEKVRGSCIKKLKLFMNILTCNYILDADGTFYVSWLVMVSACFLYNAWVIPLRAIFPYQTKDNLHIWTSIDLFVDVVYLVDVIAFKSHRMFLKEGFWIKIPSEARKSYFKTLQFKIDLAALFPADIITSLVYKNYPLLRTPRILKIESFWELFQRLDTVLASPHSARIVRTMIYMIYLIHANACAYYGLSVWEGLGTTTWTYKSDGIGNAYIRCFYFATKTATSIGKNPKPDNEMEYLYMTFAWLSGIIQTAILIGQIRDIIATATRNQEEYRTMTHAAISYLHRLGVPKPLQYKVQRWLSYTWEQQKTLDESKILDLLPNKTRSDIALDLHVETLSKVKLFQKCEVAFLRDLVLKLKSIIVLPGDYVCKMGEVGREMFIVKSGKIHVINSSGTILATLGEGSVFGEIALLGIGGMNKRTADVRAAGFVNLFVLNKDGLDEAIRDYPSSQEIMRRKAKKLMKENIKRARAAANIGIFGKETDTSTSSRESLFELGEEVIIRNKPETPKLISAMMQIFPPDSKIGRYLLRGSKGGEKDLFDKSLDNFTSYPPTPYMPASPGHISPELDISIMSGDSSEKQFSPKLSRPSSKMKNQDQMIHQIVPRQSTRKTDSYSSSEELKTYLEEYEQSKSSSGSLKMDGDLPRCSTTQPLSEGTDNENVFPDEDTFIANIPLNLTAAGSTISIFPTPRRPSTPMTFYECPNEVSMLIDDDSQGSHSSSMLAPGVIPDREGISVILRPPKYLIEEDPGLSLSSSEESEEHDVLGYNKRKRNRRDMTPQKAALIASRFLTAMKARAPPLKRQQSIDGDIDRKLEFTGNWNDDPDTTVDYDTE